MNENSLHSSKLKQSFIAKRSSGKVSLHDKGNFLLICLSGANTPAVMSPTGDQDHSSHFQAIPIYGQLIPISFLYQHCPLPSLLFVSLTLLLPRPSFFALVGAFASNVPTSLLPLFDLRQAHLVQTGSLLPVALLAQTCPQLRP